jgi:hypothetical protein
MGETQGVIRMNISVPHSLKERMDAEEGPVNWSAVAAQAFGAKLLEMASTKGADTMDEVITRLKAAAELEDKEEYQAGFLAGQEWAMSTAKPKELRRVSDYIGNYHASPFDWWEADAAEDCFAFEVWPNRKNRTGKHQASDEFWEEALGDDAHRVGDVDFLRGFGEGAVDIWEKVADKL